MSKRVESIDNIKNGAAAIRDFARTLPGSPGVYRMLSAAGDVLYVGKAKSLKKRVVAYTRPEALPLRLQRMVALTTAMEFTTTHTEAEALLLEANLIKQHRPRFNVLLRDDKSFPYILITDDHDFPQVTKHRGARSRKGHYFGPFATAGDVNETLALLQRGFLLRNCTDTVFAARKRPCLQYQIKRCTAPCVGKADKAAYAAQVAQARDFLTGKSRTIQTDFAKKMEAASDVMDYETAAQYRDRIRALTVIQSRQSVHVQGLGDADVFAAWQERDETCVQVFFFRGGQNFGNRAFFPAHEAGTPIEEILPLFIAQFYAARPAPATLLLSHDAADSAVLAQALTLQTGSKVTLETPRRGARRRVIEQAIENAREALHRRRAESAAQAEILGKLAELLGLEAAPERIEVFDNSHIAGQLPVGAMIVAGPDGFAKNAYRKFNIKGDIAPGDDYAMLREVFVRRFGRAQKEEKEGIWPDLVLIDGGKGQLSAAQDALADLGVSGLMLLGIAKGPDRNAGRETFFLPGREPFSLPPGDPVLHFLQRLRDEAHRYALGAQRGRRLRKVAQSPLDEIAGIGPGRKKALLLHFGSAKAVAGAGLEDLKAVPGISAAVAKKIYGHFHENGV